jgi:hypothetical protein
MISALPTYVVENTLEKQISIRVRNAIQKLTETIWNLDQLEPLSPELKDEYERIQLARKNLMNVLKKT